MAFKRSGVRFPSAPPVLEKKYCIFDELWCLQSEGNEPRGRGLTASESETEVSRSAFRPMSAGAAEALKKPKVIPLSSTSFSNIDCLSKGCRFSSVGRATHS